MNRFLKLTVTFLFVFIVFGIAFSAEARLQSQASEEKVYLPLLMNNYPSQQIIFVGQELVNNIYIVNEDGSNLKNLSESEFNDYQPDWSPDGNKIVFVSDQDGNPEIYIMYPDGTNRTRLTNNSNVDNFPSWSPGGDRIAFASDRDGYYEIYTMNIFGGEIFKVTNFADDTITKIIPQWSPTSEKIAFEKNTNNFWDSSTLYVINTDGSNLKNITYGPRSGQLEWSPSGLEILAINDDSVDTNVLYKYDFVNGWIWLLTPYFNSVAGATWSQDGTKIVYIDGSGAHLMDSDGSNVTSLICNGFFSADLDWSPDGTKIANSSPEYGPYPVKIFDFDSHDCSQLTEIPGRSQKWRP